ncbi:MAG TPA: CBS domain-containing protein, partial [Streptosporangiaceae bacterium]|nr:CBS domain-containing protein [Streptosporangiaceae bacterium]
MKDVMTKDVVSVRETAGYKDIVAVMRELHISAFPVLDEEDHLVGVVSEADLLLKEVGEGALGGYLISTGRRGER